jgi:site-specific DNA-cytosine methylase
MSNLSGRNEDNRALIGFAGFGGPEIALRELGIETVGIEIDAAIAEVNRRNGGHCLTADILDIDPADFVGWWLYHFSPRCPRFSSARSSKSKQNIYQRISDLSRFQKLLNGEDEIDLHHSRKIVQFIKEGRPEFFTLENVWAYQKSLSFMNIWYALLEEGYGVDWWHLNAADYGIPQSRKRMIVIARRDGRRPAKPWPTHSKNGDMFTQPWRGWHEAIEDLIPDLPESQFADWQMDRMPNEPKEDFLVMTSNTNRNGVDNVAGRGWLEVDRPANTVCSSLGGGMPRAFILGQGSYSKPKETADPADTVTANSNQTGVKAFVVDCQYNNFNGERGLIIRQQNQPIFTMTASANRRPIRAGLETGRVVSMTPRCLARFQDFPDWFALPDNRALACRGIGNALPPGLYRAVLKSLRLGGVMYVSSILRFNGEPGSASPTETPNIRR